MHTRGEYMSIVSHKRARVAAAVVFGAGALIGLASHGPAQTPAPAVAPVAAPASDPKLQTVPSARYGGKVHLLPATMETTQWGWFNNAQPPVLRIHSGDTVILETMMHSHNQVVPGVTIEAIKKLRTDHPGRGPHTMTGPIYVEEAEPGDVLKVHINKIVPRAYGTNFNVPGMFGEFPTLFPEGQVKYFYLDWEKKTAEFAPGIVIPLRPFPGTLGVARAEPGQYSTVPPGPFAGNLDIRDETEGATLYVPVFVKGALLWSGDSHATQGNGEVNLTALETAFKELNLTIEVVKGRKLEWPRIETPAHWLTIGLDRDLNLALDMLKSETRKFIVESRKLSPDEADKFMVKMWDCRVSQVVNIVKGVHCFNTKDPEAKPPAALPKADNARYHVTYGKDADLNKAMDSASLAMINLLQEKRRLSRLDSYGLASMTMDCRIAPPSGAEKEVHCLVPKSLWVAKK